MVAAATIVAILANGAAFLDHYQSLDAMARASMFFGINQLLQAISYYFIGHIAHTNGSAWPAWCAVSVMMFMASTLLRLDFALKGAHMILFGWPVASV